MLDDISAMKKVDKSDALGMLERLPEECERALKVAESLSLDYPEPSRVIITGMGGSAIGGDLMRDWLKKDVLVPIETYRGFQLPVYADRETLVIAVSYSGNTRETLSALGDAIKRRCMCVAITSGGKMLKLAQEKRIPHIKLPEGFMPRFALPYLFLAMVEVFCKAGLVKRHEEVRSAIHLLKKLRDEVKVGVPSKKNAAKMLAEQIDGKTPIIYTFGPFKAAAKRMKAELNENAKVHAFWDFFPEISHNEIEAWASELSKNFFVIFIRDKGETAGTSGELEAAKEIIRRKTKVGELYAHGETLLEKILSLVYLGDYISVYLALLQGTDPTPVNIIMELKGRLHDW